MRRVILFIVAILSFASCKQAKDIPFEEVKNYFFRNDADIPESPVIDSSEQFEELFGAAAFMGKDGQPTSIDFDKEFVIVVVNPVTDCLTELAPESLQKVNGELVFTYYETVGEQQSWTMRPILLIKVDRKYRTDSVKLCRSNPTADAIDTQLLMFPESRAQDFYKSFCQDNLGPEHLIPDPVSAAGYLKEELQTYREDLDRLRYSAPELLYYTVGDQGNYVRVDLSVILDGLVGEDAFLDAFVRSANDGERVTEEEWVSKWQEVSGILRKEHDDIPDLEKDLGTLDSLVAQGHVIMRHSDAFREAYHPHYRIIAHNIFTQELKPLIDKE